MKPIRVNGTFVPISRDRLKAIREGTVKATKNEIRTMCAAILFKDNAFFGGRK